MKNLRLHTSGWMDLTSHQAAEINVITVSVLHVCLGAVNWPTHCKQGHAYTQPMWQLRAQSETDFVIYFIYLFIFNFPVSDEQVEHIFREMWCTKVLCLFLSTYGAYIAMLSSYYVLKLKCSHACILSSPTKTWSKVSATVTSLLFKERIIHIVRYICTNSVILVTLSPFTFFNAQCNNVTAENIVGR